MFPSQIQLNMAKFLHIGMELAEISDDYIKNAVSVLHQLFNLPAHDSKIYDEIMTTTISACSVLLQDFITQITKSKEISVLKANYQLVKSLLETATQYCDKIFCKLVIGADLKLYAHSFNQYYIKFIEIVH